MNRAGPPHRHLSAIGGPDVRLYERFRPGSRRLLARPGRCPGVGVDRAVGRADEEFRFLRGRATAGRGDAAAGSAGTAETRICARLSRVAAAATTAVPGRAITGAISRTQRLSESLASMAGGITDRFKSAATETATAAEGSSFELTR